MGLDKFHGWAENAAWSVNRSADAGAFASLRLRRARTGPGQQTRGAELRICEIS
jgi:hypothetical protein